MKKVILFLSVIGMSLLMTSCLGEGSRNYSETSVAYIAMENGLIYGRTLTGRFISSTQMQSMVPGTFKFMNYSWEEEYGTTPLGNYSVDNVVVSGNILDISRTSLYMTDAPEDDTPDHFLGINPPMYAADEIYLGDHWLFEYAYEAKKGESARVDFYLRDDADESSDEIVIDIRLSITGTPEAGASTTQISDIVALNMAQLRAMYEGSSSTSTKELKIRFKYYLKDKSDLQDSQLYRMVVAGD
jgi:hypothetical protein